MPVVSINVGVKVGSVWETEKEAGLSHLLEHMVFKGTKSFGPGEIATLVEGSGGEINAYTSLDQTVYFINLSSRYSDLGLKLIKEMVFDGANSASELAREKEVVLEEIRRGKDNPHKLVGEALFGLAYRTHPYGRPVIGFEATVRNFSRETVNEFYQRWYVPSNMVLGVCGDFDEGVMRREIDAQFGTVPDCPVTFPLLPEEPPPSKPRLLRLSNPVEGTYLNLAFPIPSFTHPDIAALDLLSHLLGDGETSRLEQIVKEKKGLVNNVHSYAFTPRFSGLFVIDVQLPAGKAHKILPAVFEEIDFFKNNPAPAENLARAKLNLKSSVFYEKETCEGTARKWMLYETTAGNYRFEEEYMNAIDRATEYDIRRAANRYLVGSRASTVLLHPERQKVALTFPQIVKQKKRPVGKKPYSLVETMGDIHKYRLVNGAVVLLRKNRRVPLISLKMAAPGGLNRPSKSPKSPSRSRVMWKVIRDAIRGGFRPVFCRTRPKPGWISFAMC
ncbi:MAG: insulinase family protein [Deltaproteobacteria bacterium]|nr:insulinase family protein [Deltaproteobacteria bacterium]